MMRSTGRCVGIEGNEEEKQREKGKAPRSGSSSWWRVGCGRTGLGHLRPTLTWNSMTISRSDARCKKQYSRKKGIGGENRERKWEGTQAERTKAGESLLRSTGRGGRECEGRKKSEQARRKQKPFQMVRAASSSPPRRDSEQFRTLKGSSLRQRIPRRSFKLERTKTRSFFTFSYSNPANCKT